jgi:hypothetical protein
LNENPKHAQEVRDMVAKHIDEISAKKAIATGALALGLLGTPSLTQAQNTIKDKANTVQQDTTNTATATYAHPRENTARSYAAVKARAALATKIGKPEGEISASIVSSKMYQLPDGRYECTVTVKLN